MTKQKRSTRPVSAEGPKIRTVAQDAVSRIERHSDRWYSEYVVYIGGAYYSGGYGSQFEAECARDAAVARVLELTAA